MYQFRRAEFR